MTSSPITAGDERGFAKLVTASAISNVGDGVFLVALPLLATEGSPPPGSSTASAATVSSSVPHAPSGPRNSASALVRSAWLFGVVMALGAFSAVAWNVVTVSLRQALVPDELLGRVNSAYRFLGWGGMPLGVVVGGLLANSTNLHIPFLAGGWR